MIWCLIVNCLCMDQIHQKFNSRIGDKFLSFGNVNKDYWTLVNRWDHIVEFKYIFSIIQYNNFSLFVVLVVLVYWVVKHIFKYFVIKVNLHWTLFRFLHRYSLLFDWFSINFIAIVFFWYLTVFCSDENGRNRRNFVTKRCYNHCPIDRW